MSASRWTPSVVLNTGMPAYDESEPDATDVAVEGSSAHLQAVDEMTKYRLDQGDKRMDAIDDKLGRIEVAIAGLPTKGEARNNMLVIVGVVLAAAALLFAASGNQLSAFQAGLSSVQTVIAAKQEAAATATAPPASSAPRAAVPPTATPSAPASAPSQPAAPNQR